MCRDHRPRGAGLEAWVAVVNQDDDPILVAARRKSYAVDQAKTWLSGHDLTTTELKQAIELLITALEWHTVMVERKTSR